MKRLFSLGNIYVSDFIKDGEEPRGGLDELTLVMDDDGAVKLSHPVPLNTMFGKYWYQSGMNQSMKNGLKNVVDSILPLVNHSGIWLDIASNDGTLLSYVPPGFTKIGIDPCEDILTEQAWRHADLIIQDYFSAEAFKGGVPEQQASIITSIAMFYDVIDRDKFLRDVYEVMDYNGLWVLQQSYTPLMLQQTAFDNICHEHYYYYSLFNLKALLERNGFKVMDCQINEINGGSFRLFVMKKEAPDEIFGSQPYRDVCQFRIESTLNYEKIMSVDSPWTWLDFFDDIEKLRRDVVSFILVQKQKNKTVAAYGASTKGNTLLQYFGLDNTKIDFIADKNKRKWGLKTVGTNIPIISEEEMRERNPNYLLILPWHFITEFKEREKDYLNKGGHFIVPCPKFKVI